MPTAPSATTPRLLHEPQKPTSPLPPVSVTMTWPSRIMPPMPTLPISLNQIPWALTISSVLSSGHIGRLAGTHRIVSAGPQSFIPSQSGRTSTSISPMSK